MITSNLRSLWLWSAGFGVLFVLSLDYWWWEGPVRFGPFGLPLWIYYFILLQFALAIAIWRFSLRHWTTSSADEVDVKSEGP